MFTSQYSNVAQNSQILNLRVLIEHTQQHDYQHSFVYSVFREAPIANSEIMYFRTWRKILRSVWN